MFGYIVVCFLRTIFNQNNFLKQPKMVIYAVFFFLLLLLSYIMYIIIILPPQQPLSLIFASTKDSTFSLWKIWRKR
jgi:multisubunit Na+/H+ antiporter MnhE subunit